MRLLLLAGTGEARHIALALWREPGLSVTVSLPHSSRRPESFAWPVRIGDWADKTAFKNWIKAEGFESVIDASHPFMPGISHQARRVSADLGLDYMQLVKPFWVPHKADNWTFLNNAAEAEHHIPPGATVLAEMKPDNPTSIASLAGRMVYWRTEGWPLDAGESSDIRFLFDGGPCTVETERRLFERLGIDWLLIQNTGEQASWPKVEAARELGMPVAMIRRPRPPDGARITSVAEALAWVRRRN